MYSVDKLSETLRYLSSQDALVPQLHLKPIIEHALQGHGGLINRVLKTLLTQVNHGKICAHLYRAFGLKDLQHVVR